MDNNILISFEFSLQKDMGYNETTLVESIHNEFVGNPDYIDSNIVVHNHNGVAGITFFLKDIKDKDKMKEEALKAFQSFLEQL